MSKLEELIQKYCPEGVEYRPLGEVTLMKRGTSATKGVMQEGDIPVISGGRQPAFYCDQSNRTGETITVAGSGAGAGYVQYWNEPIFVCDAFSVKGNEELTTKYVYYFMTSIQEKIYSTKKGGGVPHVHISSIDQFEIPVPPLPVQEEIVRILDTFTELQAELQAELQKRKQQYNYYRDNLLSGDGSYSKCKIIDLLCQPITDGPHTTPQFFDSGIPFVSVDSVWDGRIHFEHKRGYISQSFDIECSKKYKPQRHDVFMVKSGSTTGKVAYVDTDESFNIWSPLAAMRVNERTSSRYLFHLLQTSQVQEQVISKSSQGSQPNLSMRVLEQFDVVVPSLERQIEIASILDRFDTLTNDLAAGLPAEIEKRRQQYEYYRDKLLTFKRYGSGQN